MSDWPIRSSSSRFPAVSMWSMPRPRTSSRRCGIAAAAVAVCLLAGGCAASGALQRGNDAERRQDYDLAVVEYTKAVRLRPEDANTRASLERSKLRASQDHFIR